MTEHEHTHELSAGYALGALTVDETRTVEQHCAICQQCAADLAEMSSIVATLPLACESSVPDGSLKRRILGAARGDSAAGQFLRHPVRKPAFVAPWWAAAAAAVFIAVSAVGVGALWDHQRMTAQTAALQSQLVEAATRDHVLLLQAQEGRHVLAALAAGRVWDMSGGPPKHWWHCTIVQPPKPGMAMIVASTPPAPKGMTYQAWVIHRGKTHNVGTMPAGKMSTMSMPMPVESGDVVAFTMEPSGGSANPTMPFVMRQTLD
jgi:anti-sigma-K factor RskA